MRPTPELVGALRDAAMRVARSHGLDVFDLQFRRESHGWVLRVFLDKPGAPLDAGVTIEDCQHVSRDLSAVLDVDDPIEVAYTLEVSSPGLDRPLRGADDYRRFVGRRAKVVTSTQVDGESHLTGRILGVEGDEVMLEGHRGRVHRVPLTTISRARLDVEF